VKLEKKPRADDFSDFPSDFARDCGFFRNQQLGFRIVEQPALVAGGIRKESIMKTACLSCLLLLSLLFVVYTSISAGKSGTVTMPGGILTDAF